jgi:Skp family chaperone for outer membrane proteins
LETAKKEAEEFKNTQLKLINGKMTVTYRKILNRLTQAVQKHAASRGFDVVYEISGNTHVGLPTLLYVKPGNATDITDDLKKMIAAG